MFSLACVFCASLLSAPYTAPLPAAHPCRVALLSFLALRAGFALLPFSPFAPGSPFSPFRPLRRAHPEATLSAHPSGFQSHLAVLALRSLRAGGSGLARGPCGPIAPVSPFGPAGRSCRFALRPPLAGVPFFRPSVPVRQCRLFSPFGPCAPTNSPLSSFLCTSFAASSARLAAASAFFVAVFAFNIVFSV